MTPITLNRLERPEVERMIGWHSGDKALPREVIEHIIKKTDGVPLYVEELTKSILASDFLQEKEDRFELTGPLSELAIPATLQDSLMARLDRIPTVREVAQMGAVFGREFAYEMLQALDFIEEATLKNGLRQLVEAELLYQRGRPPRSKYMFKHALIQDAAYQSLLKRTRQYYHLQVAGLLEKNFAEIVAANPEMLARHYTEAGYTEQALDYWYRAGQRAAERSNFLEALAHLDMSLQQLQNLPENHTRHQRELQIQTARAAALQATKGFGAGDTGDAYKRAQVLCRQLGGAVEIFPVLHGVFCSICCAVMSMPVTGRHRNVCSWPESRARLRRCYSAIAASAPRCCIWVSLPGPATI
jgi:predicted ATPase